MDLTLNDDSCLTVVCFVIIHVFIMFVSSLLLYFFIFKCWNWCVRFLWIPTLVSLFPKLIFLGGPQCPSLECQGSQHLPITIATSVSPQSCWRQLCETHIAKTLHCKNQHISKWAPARTRETNTLVKHSIPSQQKQQRFRRLMPHLNCHRKENSCLVFFCLFVSLD